MSPAYGAVLMVLQASVPPNRLSPTPLRRPVPSRHTEPNQDLIAKEGLLGIIRVMTLFYPCPRENFHHHVDPLLDAHIN